jgi:hypothetical protein
MGYVKNSLVKFPERERNFTLLDRVQTGSGTNPIGSGSSFSRDKAAGD